MKIELNGKALGAVVVGAAVAVYISTANAGSLTPTGAPAPTMTTLGEIGSAIRGSSVQYETTKAGPMAIVEIQADTQGQITGDDTVGGQQDVIEIWGWEHEIVSPRDAASGLPTGKRQHKPFTIIKEVDKASPLLMTVLVNNENCPTARFRLFAEDPRAPGGGVQGYWEVELVNAQIADISHDTIGVGADGLPLVREHVSFVYQTIIWTWEDGGITAEDDWETPIGN
ncbi:MAG: type VI secretion system tube protein TssD [Phycisphaerales bacterium]